MTNSADAECRLLLSHLRAQRAHVLGILDGLDDAALRKPVLPSGWSCLGLVRHLTLDVEQFWFRGTVAGDPTVMEAAGEYDDGWQVPAGATGESILAQYRHEAELADAIITTTALSAPPAWWPGELFGDWRLDNLREVILHVLTETACHAGHLDAARELIDGRKWLVLTG